MSRNFANQKRDSKLVSIETETSLNHDKNDLTIRSKINFSFLDISQEHGSDFTGLDKETLCTLLNHIKEHGKKSLENLSREGMGRGTGKDKKRGNIFQLYGDFPPRDKTCFREPSYIPIEAQWGRIRFGSKHRLIGFVVPASLHGTKHRITNELFDKNTFYVVFIDLNHKFYSSK